ncbi:MAG: bifunctional nuclease family protein [Bacteroidales bacterium]|jgi:bifunctional DNase/RNase|nr:bifunctional nuclease family protein [Bacteroidales bacterium]
MGKVKLNVLGISYSQTQSGAYALVLAEEEGNRRIPIIVGGFEAQAIAIELEGLNPPRPLTHDLFKNFSDTYGIVLLEVNIHKLEEGVFFATVIFDNGAKEVSLDARTSDAIALALRFKCPIFTTDEIVDKAGIVLDFEPNQSEDENINEVGDTEASTESEFLPTKKTVHSDLTKQSVDKLNEMLGKAVSDEDYEKASEIRDELKRRQKD